MNISFRAESASLEGTRRAQVSIGAVDADKTEILDHFTTADVIEHFGADALLDAIGEQQAKDHFNLVNAE